MKLIDRFNRTHNYLRISLTDRCNFNCIYCNPEKIYADKEDFSRLTLNEILRIIELFAGKLEFNKFRFTGGEPLVRKGIFEFFDKVKKLKSIYGFTAGITTNGSLLNGNAKRLKNSGIDNLNISLDSINQDNFAQITGRNDLAKILNVINESLDAGFDPVKINMVVMKGINDSELVDFIEEFKSKNMDIRFIEFMPFGTNKWEDKAFIDYKKIKEIVELKYELIQLTSGTNAVSKSFQLSGFPAKVSFITSISDHFCSTCNRLRISSKGNLRLCLFAEGNHNINFRDMFRQNYSDNEIIETLEQEILLKWKEHPEPNELSKMYKNNMMTIGG